MKVEIDNTFDNPINANHGDIENNCQVFMIYPDLHTDTRGMFYELLKTDFSNIALYPRRAISSTWIKQINRSYSKPSVIRGFHAQKDDACQAKMVEAINNIIYDLIIDMRPTSKTFGKFNIYELNPNTHNLLYVPRGFFHGVIIPENNIGDTILQYYCDNIYDKSKEIAINPKSVLSYVLKDKTLSTKFNNLLIEYDSKYELSDKDINGYDFDYLKDKFLTTYNVYNTKWYRNFNI